MKIIMVWAQRACQYQDEYVPELLDAVDEYTDSDNPGIIDKCLKNAIVGEQYRSAQIIIAEIDDDFLDKALTERETKLLNVYSPTQEVEVVIGSLKE